MNVALYCRNIKTQDIPVLQEMLDQLAECKIGVFIYKPFFESVWAAIKTRSGISTFETHEDIRDKVEYMFTLGGDGTLLDTVTFVRDYPILVMGINIGRLGFLADIGKEEIGNAIHAIKKGSYVIDQRTLLSLESNKPLFGEVNYALNDVTIHKKDTSAMITIHAYINGELLNSYWADGLIISTPTGSTGYSLSCGGPIIMPTSENFVITPIAPHNLNVRPIVFSDSSVITFEIEGRFEQFFCTLDSRTEPIDNSTQLAVKKCPHKIRLVRLPDHHFLETLRKKLMWGADARK
ncbi:MAG TPA: NAD kinase [Chitinophagales bacterium]|nr:NAD kinase [Chitinophagales bacterium]